MEIKNWQIFVLTNPDIAVSVMPATFTLSNVQVAPAISRALETPPCYSISWTPNHLKNNSGESGYISISILNTYNVKLLWKFIQC